MYLNLVPIASILALVVAIYLIFNLKKQPVGTKRMGEISTLIHKSAATYLNRQSKVLVIFVVLTALILWLLIGYITALVFIFGAFFSALAGNIGMRIATSANAKTTNACRRNSGEGLKIAFSSGSVMGLLVVGLGILGLYILYCVLGNPNLIFGFGFGASSVALFARVGGGIFTKAADVGADLSGKLEKGIPEDDPRNPAVIADLVGDNVGDVAGMGADLFESYVDAIIAAMIIGFIAAMQFATEFPLILAAIGIFSSMIGIAFVRIGKGNIENRLNQGMFTATILTAVFAYFLVQLMNLNIGIWYAILAGSIAGVLIGLIAEYYTSNERSPTKAIAISARTGAATNIITGLSVGMLSTLLPIVAIAVAILIAYHFASLYGVAIAAVGMLSTLGVVLATDAYGPVADNAAGIAEMSKLGKKVRKRAEKLDEVGNTTAAINKGFAIGAAALTALALFSAYTKVVGLKVISILDPVVIVGLLIGGMLPFLFSSFTMRAVGKAASKMIEEVRRQFKLGILESKAVDYSKCITISTNAALKEMILPAMIAILSPILIGLLLGPEALGGLLAGTIITGFVLALTMANAGGAWDNAKKYIESGKLGGKGSFAHKAAMIGDTVGDPMKDCSGPSLNILIKLMSIVALVFVPLFI